MRQTQLWEYAASCAPDPYAGVQRVVSGGQTGADRAALEAAEAVGLATGGWAAPHFWTSAGCDRTLATRFGLRAVSAGPSGDAYRGYVARTKRNVETGDATLVFRLRASPGTDATVRYVATGHWRPRPTASPRQRPFRPHLVLDAAAMRDAEQAAARVRAFCAQHRVAVLNVAGHRAAPENGPEYALQIRAILIAALVARATLGGD